MDDRNRNPSPVSSSSSSSSSSSAVVRRHRRRYAVEEDGGDPAVACTGKSCQSCTAGVIADCVALCCCPCAVVDILALAFFRLPWAVARRYLRGLKSKKRRRREMLEERRYRCSSGDRDGIFQNRRVEDGISEIVISPPSGADLTAEEVWLEIYGVGHLGFGRVSFTGVPFHNKGN